MAAAGRHPVRAAVVALTAALGCLSPTPPAIAWHHGVDVIELAREARGDWAPWIHQESGRPYRLLDPHVAIAVTPRVLDHLGRTSVTGGLTVFDDVPDATVDVTLLDPVAADDADVTVTQVPCGQRDGTQARTRPHVFGVDANGAWVDTARIEVCSRLAERPRPYVRHLLVHELAHVLGFGHLCDEPDCWPLGSSVDACEFMHPSVHPCQDLGPVQAALPRLYPSGG